MSTSELPLTEETSGELVSTSSLCGHSIPGRVHVLIGVDQLDILKVYNFVSVYATTAQLHVFLVCVYNYACMYMHIRDCKNVRMQRTLVECFCAMTPTMSLYFILLKFIAVGRVSEPAFKRKDSLPCGRPILIHFDRTF